MADRTDEALWAYLEDLHSWSMREFNRFWAHVDLRDFSGSYSSVYEAFVAIHNRSVAASLFAVDDYVTMKAAGGGAWVVPDWRDSLAWFERPTYLRSGSTARNTFAQVPIVMKWLVDNGQSAEVALNMGMARVARELASEPAGVARNYMRDYVAYPNGPEPRALTAAERAARAKRSTPPDGLARGELPVLGAEWDDGLFKQWRRVPLPGACDFCLMLATRGAVYADKRTALYATDGSRYHAFCRCRAQLVVSMELKDRVAVDAADADRTIKFRYNNSAGAYQSTYTYKVSDFDLRPPVPGWL